MSKHKENTIPPPPPVKTSDIVEGPFIRGKNIPSWIPPEATTEFGGETLYSRRYLDRLGLLPDKDKH